MLEPAKIYERQRNNTPHVQQHKNVLNDKKENDIITVMLNGH